MMRKIRTRRKKKGEMVMVKNRRKYNKRKIMISKRRLKDSKIWIKEN